MLSEGGLDECTDREIVRMWLEEHERLVRRVFWRVLEWVTAQLLRKFENLWHIQILESVEEGGCRAIEVDLRVLRPRHDLVLRDPGVEHRLAEVVALERRAHPVEPLGERLERARGRVHAVVAYIWLARETE